MDKSEFELYHEDEVLAVPTNRINTSPGSQTEQLMRVFNSFLYGDMKDAESIALLNDLDNVVGGQLDDVGEELDIPRLGKSDDVYRFMIRLRIVSRTSQGTFNDVINMVATAFNILPTDVEVKNDYEIDADGLLTGTPFHVLIRNLPIEKIAHPEIAKEFAKEIQNTLALGVTLSELSFAVFAEADLTIGTLVHNESSTVIESDVGTQDFNRVVGTTTFIRSVQQIATYNEIESEG